LAAKIKKNFFVIAEVRLGKSFSPLGRIKVFSRKNKMKDEFIIFNIEKDSSYESQWIRITW
jgi:hypothetical protein